MMWQRLASKCLWQGGMFNLRQYVPVAEASRLARSGEIGAGPSAPALLWCEPLLNH